MSVKSAESLEQFKTILEENKLIIIDFYTQWCGPCKKIAPQIEELAKKNTNVTFIKVDIDKLDDLANDFGITSIPTFYAIKSGQVIDKMKGADYNRLVQMVEKVQE